MEGSIDEYFCSSRYENITKEMGSLLNAKDFSTYLQCINPDASDGECAALIKKIFNNRLACLRRRIRTALRMEKELYSEKCSLISFLENEMEESHPNVFVLKKLWVSVDNLDKRLENNEEIIINQGRLLKELLNFYNSLASDHDFAQIINANFQEMKRAREDFNHYHELHPNCNRTNFFINVVMFQHIEPEVDCPFGEALHRVVMHELDNNPKAKESLQQAIVKTFPVLAQSMYVIDEDKYGNEELGKYYPQLHRVK